MNKEVNIENISIALEDLEDIREKINELITVPVIDLKKEIKRIIKDLDSATKDIKKEVGDYIPLIIEKI